jgi:peptidoglycan/xylan/chitin deacetylase (PgdA/CDA1 family)
MITKKWFKARGIRFIYQRGNRLLNRYGISPAMAIRRLNQSVETLAGLGCAPTFPTPGYVVQRYPKFIRSLEARGSEIAVHSYDHIDLGALPVPVARRQLERAIQTFERFGIENRGFRCPYLGWSEALRDALPVGMFDYSSNEAICFEPDNLEVNSRSEFYKAVRGFYRGKIFSENLCMPSTRQNLIEIPVCVPDDLQLHDGIGLGPEGIGLVWGKMLDQIYERGELFTLMFHPELALFLGIPFKSLLLKASQFHLPVWVARLREISDWWREKSSFKVEVTPGTTGLRLNFTCTPRATILVRGLDTTGSTPNWDGNYHRLLSDVLEVSANPRPFVGLAANVPDHTVSFLRDQGYIMDASETARSCGIYLDNDALSKLANKVELVNYIETSPAPLVRFWRWPDGVKSALCVTGDLDALTLLDYASRIFVG